MIGETTDSPYPDSMTDDIPDDELHAIVTQLEVAGLIEGYINEEGKEAYGLTKRGEPVARSVAMAGEDGEAVLDAPLGARG